MNDAEPWQRVPHGANQRLRQALHDLRLKAGKDLRDFQNKRKWPQPTLPVGIEPFGRKAIKDLFDGKDFPPSWGCLKYAVWFLEGDIGDFQERWEAAAREYDEIDRLDTETEDLAAMIVPWQPTIPIHVGRPSGGKHHHGDARSPAIPRHHGRNPDLTRAHELLTNSYAWAKKRLWADAEAALGEARDLFARVLGVGAPATVEAWIALSEAVRHQDRREESIDIVRHLHESHVAVRGSARQPSLETRLEVTWWLIENGLFIDAEVELNDILSAMDLDSKEEWDLTRPALVMRAKAFAGQRRWDRAADDLGVALDGCRRFSGDDHPETLDVRGNLAGVLIAWRNFVEARRELWTILESRRRILGSLHAKAIAAHNELCELLEAARGVVRRRCRRKAAAV